MIQLVEEEREVVLLDFITHKQRAKLRELVTNERFGEEISHIAVRADVKDTKQAVADVVSDVVPSCLQSLGVAVNTWVVGCEHCTFVVTKNWRRVGKRCMASDIASHQVCSQVRSLPGY